jgi:geranylgeranyl diphosphate synthase, type II
VADDIRDVMLGSDELGKPSGQDVQHHRPSAADDLGLAGALQYFQRPDAGRGGRRAGLPAPQAMRSLVLQESARLIPPDTCERITSAQPVAPRSCVIPLRGAVA